MGCSGMGCGGRGCGGMGMGCGGMGCDGGCGGCGRQSGMKAGNLGCGAGGGCCSVGSGVAQFPGAPPSAQDLGEYFGIVKTFNQEKGFGFIVCNELKEYGDAYVSSRNIGDFRAGAEVKFIAALNNGRLQGRNLQDASGMVGPQPGAVPGFTAEQELGVFVGHFSVWHEDKGFGFIACDILNMQGYQGDTFLHASHKGNFQPGQDVSFTAILRNGKLQARDLADPAGLMDDPPATRGTLAAMGGMSGMDGGIGGGYLGGPPEKKFKAE
eukprot:gb/GFBE01016791.1/.p1 GENE.gb/GFBE01016791.1/~~gb/GFBE01016791.1/.p1  ORF type:complete len:268 (+),score=52.51 gb/GFBE01016791.1/:1-804(+)